MLGIHNVYNCLAALAVGYASGLTIEEMQKGLVDFKPTAMRFEYKRVAEFNLINDAYNKSNVYESSFRKFSKSSENNVRF